MQQFPKKFRYAPEIPFPPYAYVPGIHYHPTHHPLGHSYKKPEPEVEKPTQDNWKTNQQYLFGVDLFNFGYYWEAHEAWEELWHACGHVGKTADFLKALIKITAAGVKVREQKLNGVQIHGTNSHKLFMELQSKFVSPYFLGLSVNELVNFSHELSINPFINGEDADFRKVIFDFYLQLNYDQ